jgi:hypothetical protein
MSINIRRKRTFGGLKAYLRATDHIRRKRTFGGLKAYLRVTDHTSSNIISRDQRIRCPP